MLTFIGDHSAAFNVVINFAILVVWMTYLQLLVSSFLRQRRSRILISRGAGNRIDSRCLVSNMSAEPIYILSIICVLKKGEEQWTAPATDVEGLTGDDVKDATEATRQGPLGSGAFMDIGDFASLARRTARAADSPPENLERHYDTLELTIVAAYASEKHSIAARREFRLDESGQVTPTTIAAEQIRSRRRRKEIDRMLAGHL